MSNSSEEEFDFDETEENENRKRKMSESSESDDSDSEDDDIPLSKLISPSKKKSTPSKSKPKTTKKKVVSKKSDNTATSDPIVYKTIAGALSDSGCVKALLIQRLLCRWWYVIEWPKGIPETPPKHYDAMDGMPGVFVCTSGDDVGKIKDFRSDQDRPSFSNFLQKNTKELKELLINAIENQKNSLIEAEGNGTETEKELRDMLKWAKKINVDKTEKEVNRILKKANIEAY